jgi:hypothetical protein
MSQDLISNQDSLAGGNGGFNTTTGFATGTKCTASGTFRASNKYMDVVQIYAAGEVFLPFPDGKKTTWYPLSPALSTNTSDGSFTSVKVDAGAV